MNGSLVRGIAFLHSWAGLLFGWVLFAIFFAGSMAIYGREITHWATPELHSQPLVTEEQALQQGTVLLRQMAPHARVWEITLPTERERSLQVGWRDAEGGQETLRIAPGTGVELRETEGGRLFNRLHHRFGLDGDYNRLGRWAAGIVGFVMLVILISGVLIHRHIFRDILTFRPRGSRLLAWADAHRLTSVIGLPFTLMIVTTSFAVNYWIYFPAAIATLYNGDAQTFRADVGQGRGFNDVAETPAGPSAAVLPLPDVIAVAKRAMGTGGISSVTMRDPGRSTALIEVRSRRDDRISQQMDRAVINGQTGQVIELVTDRPPMFATQSVMVGMHYALFGGWPMRLLYFFCGLLGAAAIATGTLLFAQKRMGRSTRWAAFSARANPGAIMAAPIAAACYLWGLRLVPATVPDRAAMEVPIFYCAMLLTIIYAAIRRPARAWRELTTLLALLCLALPLSAVTTPHGALAATLGAGDFITAGVDLAAIAIGLAAAMLALHLYRRSGPGQTVR